MIRFANTNDAKFILEIEEKMFDENIYTRLSLKQILTLINKPSSCFFVFCNDDDTPVGYALGIIINNNAMWFNSLAVLRDYQHTNGASILFNHIEEASITLNLKSIILEIRKDNKALMRRYTNMGYLLWKELKNYYPDSCSAYRLYKCIKNKED